MLLEQLSGPIGFFLGFIGKPAALSTPAVVDLHGRGLTVAATVSLTPAVDNPTAVFAGPKEAAVRLIGGRLTPAHTSATVHVDGNISLEDLRRVFPGF